MSIFRHFALEKSSHLCTLCGSKFEFACMLQVHLSRAHGVGAKSLVCEQCGKVLPHRRLLLQHIYNRHSDRQFPCPDCGQVFAHRGKMETHRAIHSSVKPFGCAHCPFTAVRRDNVLLHVRRTHRMASNSKTDVIFNGETAHQ